MVIEVLYKSFRYEKFDSSAQTKSFLSCLKNATHGNRMRAQARNRR